MYAEQNGGSEGDVAALVKWCKESKLWSKSGIITNLSWQITRTELTRPITTELRKMKNGGGTKRKGDSGGKSQDKPRKKRKQALKPGMLSKEKQVGHLIMTDTH
jgi:hypothetical protein